MGWVKASVSLLLAAAIFCRQLHFARAARRGRRRREPREQGCTFRADPSEFLQAQSRARADVFERASKAWPRKRPERRGARRIDPPAQLH